MKNLTKMILGAAGLAGMALSAAPAFAQDAPASPWAITANVAVTNDYRFRGISQSDRDPAPQGSVTVSGPEGFYVSAWASRVDFDPTNVGNPYVELDIYGGKHTDLWGVDWNLMPYYYAYPAQNFPGAPQADYFELINQLTKAFGPVTLQATYAYSPSFTFRTGEGNYLAGMASYTINDWLSISGNVGHQWVENARLVGSRDYTWGDIGVTATWKGIALDLRYSGTDLNGPQCAAFYMTTTSACKGGFVASLNYTFTLL